MNCGAKLLDGAKFCRNCGKPQSVETQNNESPSATFSKVSSKTPPKTPNTEKELFPKTGQILRWLIRRTKEAYPDALTLGTLFPTYFSAGVKSAAQAIDFTPAFLVVDNILQIRKGEDFSKGGFLQDFSSVLGMRHYEETGDSLEAEEDEIQGYIDSLALFLATSGAAVMSHVGETSFAPVSALHSWPGFAKLSTTQQSKANDFVNKHASWAISNLRKQDVIDGKHFMNEVVAISKSESHSNLYRRGVLTARDTFNLFVEFVNVVLTNQNFDN
jgi:hypothetical protein